MKIFSLTATVFAANCLMLIRDKRVVVVDPGAGTSVTVAKALDEAGLVLDAVFLTHGHPDHVWEAAPVAGDVPVFISAPDAPLLASPAGAPGTDGALRFVEMARSEWQPPRNVTTFSPGDVVDLAPGISIRTVAAPGHTPGSVLSILEEPAQLHGAMASPAMSGAQSIVLTGDVIFAGSIGRTDLPGGDSQLMQDTLATAPGQLPQDSVLLPGHGPATTLRHELATNPFLTGARAVG